VLALSPNKDKKVRGRAKNNAGIAEGTQIYNAYISFVFRRKESLGGLQHINLLAQGRLTDMQPVSSPRKIELFRNCGGGL
jgi:hypothetical protein